MACSHNQHWKLSNLPDGIFAARLRNQSYSYFEASKKLVEIAPDLTGPIGFMCCHSIELSLKAFLAAKGVSRKDMKSDGHCLACLYERSLSLGLKSSDVALKNKMVHLSEYTMLHRYPDFKMQNRLSDHDLLEVSGHVLKYTEAAVMLAMLNTAHERQPYEEDIFMHGDGETDP